MTKKLASWSALQRELGSIIERVNADPALARAAAVNPFYAIEELGYEIEPMARAEFESRIRFCRSPTERRPELRPEADAPYESGRIGTRALHLADRATFDAVRAGRLEIPLRKVLFRLRGKGTS